MKRWRFWKKRIITQTVIVLLAKVKEKELKAVVDRVHLRQIRPFYPLNPMCQSQRLRDQAHLPNQRKSLTSTSSTRRNMLAQSLILSRVAVLLSLMPTCFQRSIPLFRALLLTWEQLVHFQIWVRFKSNSIKVWWCFHRNNACSSCYRRSRTNK